MPVADQGRAKKSVVLELIRNINNFNEVVFEEISNMVTLANDLEQSWKDEQYRTFNEFINELAESLCADLDVLKEASEELNRKVKIY